MYKDKLERMLSKNCSDQSGKADKLRNTLETIYDKEIEGQKVRSREKWFEEGEKHSKYFVVLEKCNQWRSQWGHGGQVPPPPPPPPPPHTHRHFREYNGDGNNLANVKTNWKRKERKQHVLYCGRCADAECASLAESRSCIFYACAARSSSDM